MQIAFLKSVLYQWFALLFVLLLNLGCGFAQKVVLSSPLMSTIGMKKGFFLYLQILEGKEHFKHFELFAFSCKPQSFHFCIE